MKHLAWLVSASLALALPSLASATDAYVTGNVNMRAGPDSEYPLIDQLQAGTGVDVQGCTPDWEWCDVIAFGNRGWVAGNYIEYEYQDQPVLLPTYGARIGVPIIAFTIGTYWNSHYRNRPFYSQRNNWYRRPIVHRPPPPPIRNPYRGPVRPGNGPGHRPGIIHPPASPRGHLGPVGPGHPVYRVQESRQPEQAHPEPTSRTRSLPVQSLRNERPTHVMTPPVKHEQASPAKHDKAPPAKHDDKDHQHDH
ncbi:MAG: SH3 domain-containing protein [Rhodanobacter sp.]